MGYESTRDSRWISRRRAKTMAARLDELAEGIESSLGDGFGDYWATELRRISKKLAPAKTTHEKATEKETAATLEP